mmetsp:Transcript_16610/g.28005  ORF Transcript_16610/g.28005 Transcript_16610/m.28005 type:complete len:362 (+) Transcript_16610:160-1245(+)
MALVDAQRPGLLGARVFELVLLLLGRVVVNAIEGDLTGGLHGHLDVQGDPIDKLSVLRLHVDLDARAVLDGGGAVRIVRQIDLEHTEPVLGHLVRALVPGIEVANQVSLRGCRGPLTVRDAVYTAGETHVLVATRELLQTPFVLVDGGPLLNVPVPSVREMVPIRGISRVLLVNSGPVTLNRGVREVLPVLLEGIVGRDPNLQIIVILFRYGHGHGHSHGRIGRGLSPAGWGLNIGLEVGLESLVLELQPLDRSCHGFEFGELGVRAGIRCAHHYGALTLRPQYILPLDTHSLLRDNVLPRDKGSGYRDPLLASDKASLRNAGCTCDAHGPSEGGVQMRRARLSDPGDARAPIITGFFYLI